MSWRSVVSGLIALLLAGCATPAAQPARLGLKLAPAALGTSISVQQHLRVDREGRIDELDAALEVDSARIDLIGLALGQRMLVLHYDGQTLQSWRHPMVPALQAFGLTMAIGIMAAGWIVPCFGSDQEQTVKRHACLPKGKREHT